jgi:hypothetical protein
MSEEEKASEVKSRILRAATALHNACVKSYKENRCNGCLFKVDVGCSLYGHPIEWEDKLKEAKERK